MTVQREMWVRAVSCIAVLHASQLVARAEESTVQMLDSFSKENREDLLATRPLPTELHMVLHDAPSHGCIASRLSWSVANEVGTVTVTSRPLPARGMPPELITRSAPLKAREVDEVVAVATHLITTVKSETYDYWIGPLYGLDIRLDHTTQWDTRRWTSPRVPLGKVSARRPACRTTWWQPGRGARGAGSDRGAQAGTRNWRRRWCRAAT